MDEGLPPQDFENSEILDLHIDSQNTSVAVATSQKLRIIDLAKGKIRWAKDNFQVGSVKCNLRGVRFGGNQTDGLLFLVLNSVNKKQSYIQKYDINDWKLLSTTNVSPKPITAFNIRYLENLI
jgi:prolactin regulatory element-binding protein